MSAKQLLEQNYLERIDTMGLFSRKKPPAPETGLAKAVLMPSVLTMISDGSVDDGEIHQLGNLCGFSPIFAGVDPKALTGLIK